MAPDLHTQLSETLQHGPSLRCLGTASCTLSLPETTNPGHPEFTEGPQKHASPPSGPPHLEEPAFLSHSKLTSSADQMEHSRNFPFTLQYRKRKPPLEEKFRFTHPYFLMAKPGQDILNETLETQPQPKQEV